MKCRLLIFTTLMILTGCNSGKSTSPEEQTKPEITSKNWVGEWTRYIRQYEGVLNISKVVKDSICFELSASSGGNTGQTEGLALAKGNRATYFSAEGDDTCIIVFELSGDSLISVEQVKGSCFTGIGVVFSGNYYSTKYATSKSMDKKDEEVQLLDNASDNALLKKLVGKDYEVFVSTTQQTTDDSDLDNLNAKVYTSGVAGLFTLMENIIMINPNKDIWAAVINDSVIDYYTTRPDYYDKLPVTIDMWRSRFKEDKIIYKSRK